MATLSALSIVVKQDVPYLVQLAREEVDKARLERERAQMRAEDTYEFQRMFSIGYACELKMNRLWTGLRSIEFDLQDCLEVTKNYHKLKIGVVSAESRIEDLEVTKNYHKLRIGVVSAESRIEDIMNDADDVYDDAKATWRDNFRG